MRERVEEILPGMKKKNSRKYRDILSQQINENRRTIEAAAEKVEELLK